MTKRVAQNNIKIDRCSAVLAEGGNLRGALQFKFCF